MDASPLPTSLERRKQVHVRLRPDLSITPQKYEGRTYYVVKDPVSLRYYRFKDREHFLLRLMDGCHTLEEARAACEKHFPPQRLRLEEVEGFAHLLMTAGLAYNDSPQTGRHLFGQRQRHRRHQWLRSLTDVLAIQVPLIDPDRLLGRLADRLRWVFTAWCQLACTGVMLAALLLVLTHFDEFRQRLPSFREFFTLQTVVYLWLTLGAVKVLHEFGHGLSCKVFGGEVHEMGLLFLCLSPCLYCNVSDAWTLPSKWKRIVISFAGIYVELLIASLATFIWWQTPGQLFLNHVCLGIMLVCSVHTVVFNANPLLRFDGYYMLADLLEVPNLRERANRLLKSAALKGCLGIEGSPEPYLPRGRRLLLMAYALASHAYRWVVVSGILWLLYAFLKPYGLEALGGVLALAAVASTVGWSGYRFVKTFQQRGRLPPMKTRRLLATTVLFGMLVLGVWQVPLPVARVRQTALVQLQPDAADKVFVPAPAILERLYVRDGQAVREGDLLAEFRSLELDSQLEEARSEHDIRVVQLQALREQAAAITDAREKARLDVAQAVVAGERDQFARQAAVYDRLLKRLVLRAPRAGVVLSPPRPDEVGKHWQPDEETPFCVVADTRRLRALMPVSPADYQLLSEELSERADLPATVRIRGKAGCAWEGWVRRLPEAEAREVPLSLTLRGGGPLAVEPGTRPEVYVPQGQQYLVAVDLDDTGGAVLPGALAEVQVHCRWRPCAWWLGRALPRP